MGNSSSYYIEKVENNHDMEDENFIPATKYSPEERMTMDAAGVQISRNVNKNVPYISDAILDLNKIGEIEDELDLNEKISLIYLLYDDAHLALQYAIQLHFNAPLQILTEWARANKDTKWKVKLLEALCIIQNYYILCEMLGYQKEDLKVRFLPDNEDISLEVDRAKKKLYKITENLDNNTTAKLLEIIRCDFANKNLEFKEYGAEYLEMYFLYWTTIKYILPPSNLQNVSRGFKQIEQYHVAESLKDLSEKFKRTNSDIGSVVSEGHNSIGIDLIQPPPPTCLLSVSSSDSSSSVRIRKISYDEDNCYNIDKQNPGICLIINQEFFYTEVDKRWKHLLPKTNGKLENRDGTGVDCHKLKVTFEGFGFKVIVKQNLNHYKIIPAIKDVIDEVPENSCFIVCILSHGLEGKIYGVNSIPVDVKEIQRVMCNRNTTKLKGQPKVLILQSCQGQACQEVVPEESQEFHDDQDEDLRIDGPVELPRTLDMLVFWATVPGFGAIRDKKQGSWFIQCFCEKIVEKADKMHLQEIATMVIQDVMRKRWETKDTVRVMVPILESTFSKFFYLPPMKTE